MKERHCDALRELFQLMEFKSVGRLTFTKGVVA